MRLPARCSRITHSRPIASKTVPRTVFEAIDYKPFGPNWGWDWGNSCDTNLGTCTTSSTPRINQHLRQFDLDYRPITIASDPEGYNRSINWDRANRITAINVPSGITIPGLANAQSVNQAFGYDNLDRLTNFTPGVTGATTLATGLALLPKEDFTYDAIGNRLTRATQAPGATTTQTANYAYPNLTTTSGTKRHSLTSIAGANAWTYAYDASGNTTAEGSNIASAATTQFTMTYDAKNRLNKTQIGTNTADFVTYKINAMGQRVQKTGAGTYAFNAATVSSFQFNARYVYDESGNLIGEYAPDGKLITETVWFNGMPIVSLRPKGSNSGTPLGISGTTTGNPSNGATAANANNAGNNTTTNRVNVEVFYIHPDHLGTPRTVTRSTIATGANAPSSATATSPGAVNKAVWIWNSDPFGTTGTTGAGGSANSAPNMNPQLVTGTAQQIAAATFEQNLRMPGQVEDQETKKFYNYFRDLDPFTGRYKQSDPIGLKGGLNTFIYVKGNPVKAIDPFGLQTFLLPNPSLNTIVCDGNGGIIPQLRENQDNSCGIVDCIRVHEERHIADWRTYGFANGCAGRPRGTIVTFNSSCQLYRSERSATIAELDCLRSKCDGACGNCRDQINARIAQMEAYFSENTARMRSACGDM
jgi:RHS repeat-associated protein